MCVNHTRSHDELFDQEGVIVTIEEGVELAGDQCQVRQIYQEYNVFGTNPLSQLETVISSLLLYTSVVALAIASSLDKCWKSFPAFSSLHT